MASTRVAAVVLLLVAASLPGETIKQRDFASLSPEILGQGGSYAAVAEGYHALYTNPAGIARGESGELTLPSFTVWARSRPDLLLSTLAAFSGEKTDTAEGENKSQEDLILDVLKDQFTTNGFGVGTDFGIGYVGDKVGFGLNLGMDSYLFGNTFPLGLEGFIDSRFSIVVGYAQPFYLGPVTLTPGVDLRPTMRVLSIVDSEAAADLISEFLSVDTSSEEDSAAEEDASITESINALNGWGLAFDAGLLADYRDFTVGLQFRDLFGTDMRYSSNSLEEIIDALGQGGLPDPDYESGSYVIPMEVSLGAAWQPELGQWSFLVNPELHIEYTDLFGNTDPDRDRPSSLWTRMHVGSEITFFRFFDYRFGINQGYATMGFGLDLAMLELNFAIFSEEFGRYPGDQPVGGVAFEFAFRF